MSVRPSAGVFLCGHALDEGSTGAHVDAAGKEVKPYKDRGTEMFLI